MWVVEFEKLMHSWAAKTLKNKVQQQPMWRDEVFKSIIEMEPDDVPMSEDYMDELPGTPTEKFRVPGTGMEYWQQVTIREQVGWPELAIKVEREIGTHSDSSWSSSPEDNEPEHKTKKVMLELRNQKV